MIFSSPRLADAPTLNGHSDTKRVLITGGAGFIGSHVADELLSAGYRVRALDCLCPQVHGEAAGRPDYLDGRVELIVGDVCDPAAVADALDGCSAVVHLAAAVGVGQSMYALRHYTRVNDLGTATLLEALIDRPVEKLVVASSMSVYGEGLYERADATPVHGATRRLADLKADRWEPTDDHGRPLTPVPTTEDKRPDLASVYALGKYAQERMCLMVGGAYGIATTALRFFNVYGPRQALSNPYTGVLAIFAGRLLNGQRPMVFEDGLQQRDFAHVRDVARMVRLCLESIDAAGEVFNVGSGQPRTIKSVAESLAKVLGREELRPELTGRYRVGDIRHCFADITKARRIVGYEPAVEWEEGLAELADWLSTQTAEDRVAGAAAELAERGLSV